MTPHSNLTFVKKINKTQNYPANDYSPRTKQELKNSEIRYRRLFESARDGILILDAKTLQITDVNPYMIEFLGYSRDKFIGSEVWEIGLLADKEKNQAAFQKLRKTGYIKYENMPLKTKSGECWDIECVCNIYQEGNRQVIQCNIRDITARKQSEKAIASLVENDKWLKALLDASCDGIVVEDSGQIVYVNHSYAQIFKYDEPEELIGKNRSDILPPFEVERLNKFLRRRLLGDETPSIFEFKGQCKDGTLVELEGVFSTYVISGKKYIMTAIRNIAARKLAEQQLLHDTLHDDLTGLANRTLFMHHLHSTIKTHKRRLDANFAVLFLDFDGFKVINDSLGHAEGDNLLKQIARRLEFSLRPGDLVARIGGDEFTILLPALEQESDALQVTERVLENLKGGFDLSEREVFISASVGIALSTVGYTRAEDMLRDADTAMYRAKAQGKACYRLFDQEMHKDMLFQMQIETDMRHALESGEFLLQYQPIIDLDTTKIAGFESLVRWRHPTRGLLSPNEFIPKAEETGLILPLGKWILNESCRQLREWQIGNQAASALIVSVNLSSKQFLQTNLVEQVAAALDSSGLKADCLKLEITESYILENTKAAVATMNDLRALGIEISLDDFGTGYSSLSYLQNLPIDYLKIDRSFINRMIESKETAEIVDTIIKMAQNLKMKVVAEGIETAPQLSKLQELHCEYGQGYFFSEPLAAAATSFY